MCACSECLAYSSNVAIKAATGGAEGVHMMDGLCTHVLLVSGSPCALSLVCGALRTCALHISCCSTGVETLIHGRHTPLFGCMFEMC